MTNRTASHQRRKKGTWRRRGVYGGYEGGVPTAEYIPITRKSDPTKNAHFSLYCNFSKVLFMHSNSFLFSRRFFVGNRGVREVGAWPSAGVCIGSD